MTVYDHAGHPVHAEDVLDREELADYYDRHGIEWRRGDEAEDYPDTEPDEHPDDDQETR